MEKESECFILWTVLVVLLYARARARDMSGASVWLKAGEPDLPPVVGGSAGSNLRASKLCPC